LRKPKSASTCVLGFFLGWASLTALAQGQEVDTTIIKAVPDAAAPVMRPEPAAPSTLEIRDALPRIATIDLTAEPSDVWERIRNGFSMPNLDSDLVTQHQAWYLNRPQQLSRILERSRRYLFHIVQEIEKRGVPTELALLPVVESAYNPMALSPARASGIWQFIPSTGRTFKLEQNWWIDQRRDIVASTAAALEYLQTIYDMHGDWHLALASYNWGENAVARAIERNQSKGLPTDYLSLAMPAETRNYVPKLQALKNIIARPHLFGIALEPVPNRPYFVTVEQPADMDIALAARLAEVPLNEFRALNPAYNRPVASGQSRLVLPADKADVFLANLEAHNKPLVTWQSYTLKRGDKLNAVAQRFGIALARLREINGIGPRTKPVPGQSLLVPARDVLSPQEPLADNSYVIGADEPRARRVTPMQARVESRRSVKVAGGATVRGAGSRVRIAYARPGKTAVKASAYPVKSAWTDKARASKGPIKSAAVKRPRSRS